MLKKRIITAVCLLVIFLTALFLLPIHFFAAFVALALLAGAWEWANLSGFETRSQRVIYSACFAGLMLGVGAYLGFFTDFSFDLDKTRSVFLAAGLWWAVALLWVQGYPASAVLWGNRWIRVLIGFLTLVPSGVALVFLYGLPQGHWLILLLVVVVATADTGAYFSGRAFGRRKLAKNVSPGKSWEGVWGGLVSCALLALVVAAITDFSAWLVLLAITLPTAMVSVLGDLLESMLKRHRGIKDSGRILPGHGGVLDRIDGLTAAAPIFSLAIILSGWQLSL